MNKRHKIIISSVILSIGLLGSQFVPFFLRFRFIGGLTLITCLLTLWSLWGGLTKSKAVILLILPTLFTLAVSGYYFLIIPFGLRLAVAVIFGLIIYTLLLSQNIFNISAIRTIPLYRVSFTVSLLITVFTAFLLFWDLFSLELFFLWNGLVAFLVSFPLVMQALWSVEMDKLTGRILAYTTGISFVVAETSLALSFWPINKPLAAIILSASIYVALVISIDDLKQRLNRGEVVSLLSLGLTIFLIIFLVTSWTG